MDITVPLILEVLGIIIGAWLTAELVIRLTTKALRRAGASAFLIRNIREALTILWIVLAVVAVLTVTGYTSIVSLVTVSGLVALTVSLALQNTLSNMISGILLLTDRVLSVNDVILYGGVKGTVVRIGLRSTWVKTETGEIAVMSNSYLLNGPFINYTATKRLERKLRA